MAAEPSDARLPCVHTVWTWVGKPFILNLKHDFKVPPKKRSEDTYPFSKQAIHSPKLRLIFSCEGICSYLKTRNPLITRCLIYEHSWQRVKLSLPNTNQSQSTCDSRAPIEQYTLTYPVSIPLDGELTGWCRQTAWCTVDIHFEFFVFLLAKGATQQPI